MRPGVLALLCVLGMQSVAQPDSIKRVFLKLNLTNVFLNQVSVGLERQLQKKAMEVEFNYNFASPGGTDQWKYNLYFNEQGVEIKPGIMYTLGTTPRTALMAGLALSYRYSHISSQTFVVPPGYQDQGTYRMSQTRNLAGLFLKLNYRLRYKGRGFDFFLNPGVYAGYNQNTYFDYSGDKNNIPHLKTWYMKDGFQVLPYINLGAAFRLVMYRSKSGAVDAHARKSPVADFFRNRFEPDSAFKTKHVFRFQLTSLLASKISVAYEHVFRRRYSWEIQPACIFKNPVYHSITQIFLPNYSFQNEGFEVLGGLNFLNIKRAGSPWKKHARSRGFFISYRYQHVDNFRFWTGGISGKTSGNQDITLSETKNAVGIFYKRRFFRPGKQASIEKFIMFGCYTALSRKTIFEIYDAYSYYTSYPDKPEITVQFFPVIRAGLAIRLQ